MNLLLVLNGGKKAFFFIEVTYKSSIYNDLASLIIENDIVKGKRVKKLPTVYTNFNNNTTTEKIFVFDNFVKIMESRKDNIIQIRMKGSEEIKEDIKTLYTDLKDKLVVKGGTLNEESIKIIH